MRYKDAKSENTDRRSPHASASEKRAGSTGGEKLPKIITVIRELIEIQFTGYIKVNFTDGKIGRIEKFEEILRTKK
jgi:hypothetical protein